MLSQPAHPAFIVGALWSEFIVDPPDPATLQNLTSIYTKSGFQLKPLLQAILTHPLLFDSIAEPNMVKPPVVYVVGAMRALGVGVTDSTASDYLDAMGQQPYFPPNVSGWEGGLSWLNTDTALARFSFISTLVSTMTIADVAGESADAAFARAYTATGSPWLASGTQSLIQNLAASANASTAQRSPPASGRAARADPRRPRRPGDVMNDRPTDIPIRALRCADCERSDSLVAGLAPTSRITIPAEALAGFPDGVPRRRRGVSRRSFLAGGALGIASVYSAAHLTWESIWNAAAASAAAGPQNVVVCIYLQGGNDGLNTIVPVGSYSAYQSQRSNIARANQSVSSGGQVGVMQMPNSEGLAFANPCVSGPGNNGDTKGFDTLYGDGSGGAGSDLAVFPAADYQPPDLSHFDSRDYWFAGALEQLETGWLGRWLDLYGSTSNPLQAISLSSSLSKQIRTANAPVCAISSLSSTAFEIQGTHVDANAQVANLAAVPVDATNTALARSRAIYGETVQVSNRLSGLNAGAPGGGYPGNSGGLSDNLQLAAMLLGAGLGTRVITIDWGSFDTHGDQVSAQDPQLAILSSALAAFKNDLQTRGVEGNVVTLVFSEFGRRIASNDSAGTDHGAGGLVLVSGSSVRGGQAGEHPGVAGDADGDVVPITDFRTVYQSLIGEWLGGDPTAILPGGPFPGIARYDGGTTLMK